MLVMSVNVGNGSGTSPSRALYPLEEWQLAPCNLTAFVGGRGPIGSTLSLDTHNLLVFSMRGIWFVNSA
jgi:hypothetical protein